jgi:hypothetical protein
MRARRSMATPASGLPAGCVAGRWSADAEVIVTVARRSATTWTFGMGGILTAGRGGCKSATRLRARNPRLVGVSPEILEDRSSPLFVQSIGGPLTLRR